MHRVVLDGDFEHWRAHARSLAASGVEPDDIRWVDPSRLSAAPTHGLFDGAPHEEATPAPPTPSRTLQLPRDFAQRLPTVTCHSDASTWDLCYRLLWRLLPGALPHPLAWGDVLDADIAEFRRRDQAVRRDAHKMHAFVRFRRVAAPDDVNGERFVAWHQPLHRIAEREADFFRRRFPSMAWSILTPHRSAHWDTSSLTFASGVPADAAPQDGDALEELWLTYYGAIFNPARIKLAAMRAEMPVHHWATLPETKTIPGLLADAPRRLAAMAANSAAVEDSAAPFVPDTANLETLGRAARNCRGCELCDNGTRVVFGEGPATAHIVLLGEQPGDQEERAGRPFVGPAGQVLDAALRSAHVERDTVYLTNSVKHFHHRIERHHLDVTPDGSARRLHAKPRFRIVSQCQPWLDAEMRIVQPRVLVCLGATATRAVFGPSAKLAAHRGKVQSSRYASTTLATFHPSAVLRGGEPAQRLAAQHDLEKTLRTAAAIAAAAVAAATKNA